MQKGELMAMEVMMEMIDQMDTAAVVVEVAVTLGVQAATCSTYWGLPKIVKLFVAHHALVRVALPSFHHLHLLLHMSLLCL